nr:RHS repeat-associated core domain-containing protein [Enterobacter cloacae]
MAEGADNCLRLPGQYEDRETGLFYNLHRYYDPRHGRYITPDPVGLDGGLNQYAYVPDPLSWIDPLGLCKTGTVWDDINPTQSNYPGTVIPKSFEMTLPNGQRVWVHGNATEHMAEYAQYKAKYYIPDTVRLTSQE